MEYLLKEVTSDLGILWLVHKPTGQSGGMIQYDFGKTVQEGQFKQIGSLNRPPDVLLTALANLQSKHMMEGYGLAQYLSEMLGRHLKMAAQFARPDIQYNLLYDVEYDYTVEYMYNVLTTRY